MKRKYSNSIENNQNKLPIYFNTVNKLESKFNGQTDAISLTEILNDKTKVLQSSVHFNFLFQLDWLLLMYPERYRNSKITIVCSKERRPAMIKNAYPNVTFVEVKLPIYYGIHHSKMIILFYQDCCQLIILTANMTKFDWENLSQLIWKSPYFYKNTLEDGDVDEFKSDLIMYLKSYQLSKINDLANSLLGYNMTSAKVKLVASSPGYHRGGDISRYGHMRMREILSSYTSLPENSKIVGQFSSIGTYGKEDSWLFNEWSKSMIGMKYIPNKKDICFIFPTEKNILESFGGIEAGEAFPYMSEVHNKQLYFKNYLCKWIANSNGRTKAAPHLKYYCSLSSDQKKVNWFLLTSANLSKSAWGQLQKGETQLCIRSYELGVLFLPDKYNAEHFNVGHIGDEPNNSVAPSCLIPTDLPLTRYSEDDEVWVYNKYYLE